MNQYPLLKLGQKNLKFVDKIKLLGVYLDSKMTMGTHINNLVVEGKKRINIMKSIACKNWGADQSTLMTTYRAIVRSKLDYGSIFYQTANSKYTKKLDSIHHQALRIATRCFRTSPLGSILIEAREPSLEHRRKFLTLKYSIKAKTSKNPIIEMDVTARNDIIEGYVKNCFLCTDN